MHWHPQVKALAIPASEGFDFALFLADPKAVRDWNIQVGMISFTSSFVPGSSSGTDRHVLWKEQRQSARRYPPLCSICVS
jgi:hypothetical protein